jgi:hypothetical protein
MDKKFYFGTYVPKAYRELATEEERSFSEWVINFKDGQKAQLKEGAQMVIAKLREWYGDKARELVVVPVPASSMAQYRYRFAYFCVVVANTLGQLNPMQHVTILGRRTAYHRNPAHTAQEDNYEVQIDADFFKGRKVVVLDDIVSSGATADRFAQQLEEAGAEVKGGIFFARTKNAFGQAQAEPAPSAEPLPPHFGLHSLQAAERMEKGKAEAKANAEQEIKASIKAAAKPRSRRARKEAKA